MQRRQLLLAAMSSPAVFPLWYATSNSASAIDFAKPVPEAEGVTAYHKDGAIHVRLNNLPVLAYRAQSSLKYPYFGPLNGPASGQSLVAESAEPYPHHRGLWLGCDPINGGNYWADNGHESGQILSTDLSLTKSASSKSSVAITDKCVWSRSGSNPLNDRRRFTITITDTHHVLLDCQFILTAAEDIAIKSAKHSFFALRVAADISPSYGGTLVNSNGGMGADGTYGKSAAWCSFFGKRDRKSVV